MLGSVLEQLFHSRQISPILLRGAGREDLMVTSEARQSNKAVKQVVMQLLDLLPLPAIAKVCDLAVYEILAIAIQYFE